MTIQIKKVNILINTFDYIPIYPADITTKQEVIDYETKNPFPTTEYYSKEMMLIDMQHNAGGGILTFTGLTGGQMGWIETFLNAVI